MFSSVKAATVVAVLSGLVAAGPVALPLAENDLASRGSQEAVYLVNCHDAYYNYWYSEMAYYSNGKGGSQNQQKPDDTANVSGSNRIQWEGQSVTGKFGSGTSATSHIQSNGQSVGVGNYAGYASNSYGQGFNCYEDNQRQLYSQSDLNCYSIYYCFDS